MVSMSGIIGHEVRTFREFDYPWEASSLMVLHSDGVGTRWDLRPLSWIEAQAMRLDLPAFYGGIVCADVTIQR